MQKIIKLKLILFTKAAFLISFAFIFDMTGSSSLKADVQIQQGTTQQKETPAEFKTKAWTENADILNLAMELNPEGIKGIYAMYKSRHHAIHALEAHATRATLASLTIKEKLHALIDPVKAFLPQVKQYKEIVKPLIEVSLNRAYTAAENEKFASQIAPLSFQTSIFSRFLNSQEGFDVFMEKTITTEAEYVALCQEFQRVFTDLLEHAFPNLTKKFLVTMAQQQKAVTASAA